MKVLENNAKIAEIEARLNKYGYLSKATLPGYADGRVFLTLEAIKRYPDRSINPNFYHWYILMKQFSPSTTNKWVNDQLYHDPDDSLITEFVRLYSGKKDCLEGSGENESKIVKNQSTNEFQYTVDIYVNHWVQEKIKELQHILEEYKAEIMEIQEKEKSKFIRVLCRMEAARSQEMVNKISACIEFANIEIKKRAMKTPVPSQEKNSEA